MSSKAQNPYLIKDNDKVIITPEGYSKLSEFVTDTTGPVYVFNGKLSAVKVAAAMARLSRRKGDMREIILDEFMDIEAKQEDSLIKRVVSEYGDDSVQQLIGLQFVVEDASNLLTKILEKRRFASYLEQSTRYIFFDKKDKNGRYSYYTPELNDDLTRFYNLTMDKILDLYSIMVRGVTAYLRKQHPEPTDISERQAWLNSTRAAACDAVRRVLPVAVKSTVGIFASAQAVEYMVMNLLSDPIAEARIVGEQILREARKVTPAFLERADQLERGGMISAYISITKSNVRDLAREYLDYASLPLTWSLSKSSVRLVSYWPDNELDLVPEILFEHAEHLSLSEIERQVASWDNVKKAKVFRAYIGERFNRRARPGRAFEKAHFEWEIVGDYGTFRDLQRHRVVDSMEWQRLSPFLGYDVPDLVREAGFEHDFRQCFVLSSELFDEMSATSELEAQYATLLGHRMRYRLIANLREAFHIIELRTGPAGHPGYRKICNQMFDQLKEVYPMSGEGMKFVNQGEDPELARLAAELATQKKLKKLD